MDPFATAAEIATILSATEALPHVQSRRASRKERREAYIAYQREAYRLMSGINHLSVLAQVKTITWREVGSAVVPMVPSFVEYVLPAELSENSAIRRLQEMARGAATIAKSATQMATSAVESSRRSDIELRNRAIVDIATVRDSTADFMSALAEVRLIGRHCVIAAADVIRVLLQEMIGKIPSQPQPSIYTRLRTYTKEQPNRGQEFAYCIDALTVAFSQYHSVVGADRLERTYPWQVWRRGSREISSARGLLEKARNATS